MFTDTAGSTGAEKYGYQKKKKRPKLDLQSEKILYGDENYTGQY